MKCIVGLGNPGPSFDGTRHNVGFRLIDLISREFSFPTFLKKFNGLLSRGLIYQQNIYSFKPCTYMNNSGAPLLELVSFYKLDLTDVLVMHDDVDLPFGKVKVKHGGGNGGHNGLKSIDRILGSGYWRLRVGVGKPEFGDLADYVLSKFNVSQDIESVLGDVVASFKLLLEKDIGAFIQKLN